MIHLHHQTLLTYASVLAHYLHIRTTPVPTPGATPNAQTTSKTVPDKVLERLYQLKHALSVLEDIGFSAIEKEEDEYAIGMAEGEEEEDSALESEEGDSESDDGSVDMDDLDAKYSDAAIDAIMGELESGRTIRFTSDATTTTPSKKKNAISKSSAAATSSAEPLTITLPAKKKKKIEKKKGSSSATAEQSSPSTPKPANPFDLEEREFGTYAKSLGLSSTPSSSSSSSTPYYAFGEAASLSQAETDSKSARKKSLKFHTSKIESASRRREAARARALGGDDDIPFRDEKGARMERERRAAAAAQAGKAGQGGDDLDDEEPGPTGDEVHQKGRKRPREEDGDGEGDGDDVGAEGYYDLVKKSKKQAKVDKKAAYDAEIAANKYVSCLRFIHPSSAH